MSFFVCVGDMTPVNSMSQPQVILKCIKEGTRLRVRIVSPGYHHEANCQFPRNIRVEDAFYCVPAEYIRLARGPRGKFFYRVSKAHVSILSAPPAPDTNRHAPHVDKVYGDDDTVECVVCMAVEKSHVFVPCGHYACCGECASAVQGTSGTCPMCRQAIDTFVHRQDIG